MTYYPIQTVANGVVARGIFCPFRKVSATNIPVWGQGEITGGWTLSSADVGFVNYLDHIDISYAVGSVTGSFGYVTLKMNIVTGTGPTSFLSNTMYVEGQKDTVVNTVVSLGFIQSDLVGNGFRLAPSAVVTGTDLSISLVYAMIPEVVLGL